MTEPRQHISATATTEPGPSGPPEPLALVFGRILWHGRCFVLLGALLPALLVAVVLYLLPTAYRTTLVYERPLGESEYRVLSQRFYSGENLDRIIASLREQGIDSYAARLEQAETKKALERLIRVEPFPAYPTRLRISDPEILERIDDIKAQLLYVELTNDSKDVMPAIAEIIAANLENVMLLSRPAAENPAVYRVPKHVLERSILAFIVALMIATFLAVTLEQGRGRGAPSPSPPAVSGLGG